MDFNIFEIIVAVLLVILALLAIGAKQVLHSVIYLSVMSMLAVVSFLLMESPDVAITEAVIGAGLVTAIFLFTFLAEKSDKKVGEKE
jgi:energy-converting hydrogenase B subunit D